MRDTDVRASRTQGTQDKIIINKTPYIEFENKNVGYEYQILIIQRKCKI